MSVPAITPAIDDVFQDAVVDVEGDPGSYASTDDFRRDLIPSYKCCNGARVNKQCISKSIQ